MRLIRHFAALSLCVLVNAVAIRANADTIAIGGETRSYLLDGAGTSPKPLIVALHGGGGSPKRFRRSSGLLEAAGEGFVIAWPESDGGNWNDGRLNRRGQLVFDTADEVFILSLIKDLIARGIADPNRVYVTGHSNGGMMSFALGCRNPSVFKAIGPVSANIPEPMNCEGRGPISVLNIVGLDDRVVPFDGGGIFGRKRRGSLKSVEETLQVLAARNVCKVLKPIETVQSVSLTGTGCKAPTAQIRIKDQGHSWPKSPISAAQSIVTFFSKQ